MMKFDKDFIIGMIGLITAIGIMIPVMWFLTTSSNPDRCWEELNINTTDVMRMGNHCYYTDYIFYTTHRYCTGGILGIGEACTLHEELIYKSRRIEVCKSLKTGELC